MPKKLNKQIKQLDAAARLVLAGRKKSSVVINQGGLLCSTGLDATAPCGLPLPKGIYPGDQLLEVFAEMKYCAEVQVTPDQIDEGWRIMIFDPADANKRVWLDWQDCREPKVAPPSALWPVDKEHLKMFKASWTMAQALIKSQLRLLRLQPEIGVMSYLSPSTVAQWWDQDWVRPDVLPDVIDIEIADLKRAASYKGAKIIAIGASDGKINFAYDDGAFLRVDKYDGPTYEDDELAKVFIFDETSYVWPLGADQPAQALLELIAGGKKESETDGTIFYPDIASRNLDLASAQGSPMPLQCGPCKYTPKVINQLVAWAEKIQISGVSSLWDFRSMGFHGVGYRAVTSTSFYEDEAVARGLVVES